MAGTRGSVDDDVTAERPTVERTPSTDGPLSVEPEPAPTVERITSAEPMIDPMPTGQMLVPATPGTDPADLPPLLIVPSVHPLTARPLGLAFPPRGDEVAAVLVPAPAAADPVLETPHAGGATRVPFRSSILRRRATAVLLGAVAASSALIWLGLWASNTPSLDPGTGLERPQTSGEQPGDTATGQQGDSTDGEQGDGQPDAPAPAVGTDATAVTPLESVARVTDDDQVAIEQRLQWPGDDGDTLLVALPPLEGLVGAVADVQPEVVQLQARVDGTEVEVEDLTGDGTVWSIQASPSGDEREVLLDYTLDGTVVMSRPSEAGRALALVVPLVPAGFEGDPAPIRTVGPKVLNVQCLGVPFERALCGEREIGGWYVQPPAGADPYVLLQVNLLAGR